MSNIISHHRFEPKIERYDEMWSEPRQYIKGSFGLFGGVIKTEYRKDLLFYKERETDICRCGESKNSRCHATILFNDGTYKI